MAPDPAGPTDPSDGPAGGPEGSDGGRARSASAEQVEVVAGDGTVERVVTRAEMRAGRLRHRCTYIVVVDDEGRVVVHQRAAWKDLWPSRWDLAFGGVVGVGEGWAEAARRELAEEAGVDAPLTEVGAGTYTDADADLVGRVYLARHDGPYTFPDGEVVASDRVAVADVLGWIADRPHCPDAVALAGPAIRRIAEGGYPAAVLPDDPRP